MYSYVIVVKMTVFMSTTYDVAPPATTKDTLHIIPKPHRHSTGLVLHACIFILLLLILLCLLISQLLDYSTKKFFLVIKAFIRSINGATLSCNEVSNNELSYSQSNSLVSPSGITKVQYTCRSIF